jgi:hypothetical protein
MAIQDQKIEAMMEKGETVSRKLLNFGKMM